MKYPRLILAGTSSGVGKTTLTLGIILSLRKRGMDVQSFKTGPDYIDPTYYCQATGRDTFNLDSWLISQNIILELFKRHAKGVDISVIEGVMGLYDGFRDREEGSTAHLAKILRCPVILILDARSMSRSAGAVALGYKQFDRRVEIAGMILNNIGTHTHYTYVKSVIESSKVNIRVLGYLPKRHSLKLPERHLGLVPLPEKRLQNAFYKRLLSVIEENIDIDGIIDISRSARPLPQKKDTIFVTPHTRRKQITIAVARDRAFNFYYQDNLEILIYLGARIVEFSPMDDKRLPGNIDGLYIGGGFPELFAYKLSKNTRLKNEIYRLARCGMPVYAECGGLMYLVETLTNFKRDRFLMVGIFRCSVNMGDRLRALGYVTLETISDNILSKRGDKIRAHVFHWSYLTGISADTVFAYRVRERDNIFYDGLIKENVLASYTHLHFASNIDFARNFVKSCWEYREKNVCNHQS